MKSLKSTNSKIIDLQADLFTKQDSIINTETDDPYDIFQQSFQT